MTVGSLITEVLHPFGRAGSANTTGAIYGATVTTTATTFTTVETVTIPLPSNAIISELQYSLTVGLGINPTTAGVQVKYLLTNTAGTSYDTTASFTSTTVVSLGGTSANSGDFTCFRTITPSDGTNFTGKGSFDMLCQLATPTNTTSVLVDVKQSSYLQYSYYLIG